MPLFSRRRRADATPAIPAFWAWWRESGHRLDPHDAAGTKELTRRVTAIHPELQWHFGPGATAQHRLTLSCEGAAAARPWAERWYRAAPPPDGTWEFRPSKEADPGALDGAIRIAGHELDLSQVVFDVDPDPEQLRVHVGVHHAQFGALPDTVRGQVSFLVLDWLLGEDDVERWVGAVEALTAQPAHAQPATALQEAIAAMVASRSDDDWAVGEAMGSDGLPALGVFRRGVRWLDHPTHDLHHVIEGTYQSQANGLPADEAALAGLRQLEDQLGRRLGSRGLLIGHESHAGRRRWHVYTDSEDQNAEAELAQWVGEHDLQHRAEHDPSWTKVRHLTG